MAINGVTVDEEDFWVIYEPPITSFIVSVLRQDFWDREYHYDLVTSFDLSGDNDFVVDLAPYLSSPGEDLRYLDVFLAIIPRIGIADYSFSVVPT